VDLGGDYSITAAGNQRCASEPPSIDRRHDQVHSTSSLPTQIRRLKLGSRGGKGMIGIGDLFQWERFVTPTVIKVFYWLAVVISVLLGLSGALSSLATMAVNPFVGMMDLIVSLLGGCMGIVASRIVAEFVLIVFRINEHLGAIRNQGAGIGSQDQGYRGP